MAAEGEAELSFISFRDHGTKATKRLQRQHIIRRKTREKNRLFKTSDSSRSTLQWLRKNTEGLTSASAQQGRVGSKYTIKATKNKQQYGHKQQNEEALKVREAVLESSDDAGYEIAEDGVIIKQSISPLSSPFSLPVRPQAQTHKFMAAKRQKEVAEKRQSKEGLNLALQKSLQNRLWTSRAGYLQMMHARPSIPKQVSAPISLKVAEEMCHVLRAHTLRRLEFRAKPKGPDIPFYRDQLDAEPVHVECASAFDNALNMLTNRGQVKAVAASLEQGFRLIEPNIREDHFLFISTIMEIVDQARIANQLHLGKMLLNYCIRMSAAIFHRTHPIVVCLRAYLILVDVPGINEYAIIMEVLTDALEEMLGPQDPSVILRRISLDMSVLKNNRQENPHYNIVPLLANCKAQADQCASTHMGFTIKSYLAEEMLLMKEYQMVEWILCEVPILFDKLLSDTKLLQVKSHILRSMMFIGKAKVAQGQFDDAVSLYSKVLPIMNDLMGSDHPFTIEGITAFGNLLSAQSLDDDARAMYSLIDQRLARYMLQPEEQIAASDLVKQDTKEDEEE